MGSEMCIRDSPKDKILDNPESKDDQDSALGAMGLKPKIVH